jgi:ribose transport system permease protein
MTETAAPQANDQLAPSEERFDESTSARVKRILSVRNIGAIYIWIIIIVVFALLSDQFFTSDTLKSVLNQGSITGIVALSLVVPLAAGYFDLSIGYTVSFSGVFVAWLLANSSMSPVVCGLICMAGCVAIGLFNAFIVVGLGVDSFIGTLGSGAILSSLTIWISNEQSISGRVGDSFSKIGITSIDGFNLPVLYLLGLMVALAYWLERTQMGREFYATGFDRETARLGGVRVDGLATISFITSASLSGFAGMVLAATISSGSPTAGISYLIPAFSAAFLGATQLRGGRFNPWGTVIAVLLLGTGNVGLLLAGGPIWTPQLFEGTALIVAVALTGAGRGAFGTRVGALMLRWRRAREGQGKPSAG